MSNYKESIFQEPNISYFCKYLSSVLKTHGSDLLEFETSVEKNVFEIVKYDFITVSSSLNQVDNFYFV